MVYFISKTNSPCADQGMLRAWHRGGYYWLRATQMAGHLVCGSESLGTIGWDMETAIVH